LVQLEINNCFLFTLDLTHTHRQTQIDFRSQNLIFSFLNIQTEVIKLLMQTPIERKKEKKKHHSQEKLLILDQNSSPVDSVSQLIINNRTRIMPIQMIHSHI